MRVLRSILVLACLLGPVAAVAAPTAVGRAAAKAAPAVRTARPSYTAVEYNGKMLVQYSVIVNTALRTSDQIVCSATALTMDVGTAGVRTLSEEASSVATRSGSNATCSVTVPYAWSLASAANDTIVVTSKVSNLTSSGLPSFPERTSSQTIGTLAVPASGTTTKFLTTAIL